MPDQLCALDFSKLQGKNYWYHIVYMDENGTARAGYVKESNFVQLTASGLTQCLAVPENAALISQLIALAGSSPLFIGETQATQSTQSTITGSSSNSKSSKKQTYVLNTNTHKFHRQGCSSIKQMKAKNKKVYTGTRQEIINMGYSPCKKCNP